MTNAPASAQVAPAAPANSGVATTAAPAHAAKINGGTKKGSRKSRGGKKSRKMPSAAKNWVKFVVEVFNKNRAKNPKYKYKQAMKDAAILKKKNNKTLKGGDDAAVPVPPVPEAAPTANPVPTAPPS